MAEPEDHAMLASPFAHPSRHVAVAVALGAALISPVAAADPPPDLPPLVAPQPGPAAPRAAQPAPGQPAPGAPRAPGPGSPAPLPPGLSWMSPAETPPGYPQPAYAQPYPGYYPMPYPQAVPRQESYVLPPPPPRQHQSTGMFVGGVLMVSGGLVGVIAGAVLVSSSANRIDIYCDSPSFPCAHKDDAARKGAGAAVMTIGALVGAAGIPMWIVGARLVPAPKDEKRPALVPDLRVGAGTATVTVSF
jgi:hypothetical protein